MYGRVGSCDNVTVLLMYFCCCVVGLVNIALMNVVAAVMLKVECAVRLWYTSVTSQSCKWNEVFFMKVIQVIEWIFFHNSHSFLTLLNQHWVSSL